MYETVMFMRNNYYYWKLSELDVILYSYIKLHGINATTKSSHILGSVNDTEIWMLNIKITEKYLLENIESPLQNVSAHEPPGVQVKLNHAKKQCGSVRRLKNTVFWQEKKTKFG